MTCTRQASGRTVLLDEQDAPLWDQHRWSLCGGRTVEARYAARHVRVGGKHTAYYFHRLILEASCGMEVDHINRNRLDNRRANLRLVTRSENEQNKPLRNPRSATGHRNVYFNRARDRYYVRVWVAHTTYVGRTGITTLDEAISIAANLRKALLTHAPESEGAA